MCNELSLKAMNPQRIEPSPALFSSFLAFFSSLFWFWDESKEVFADAKVKKQK